MMLNQTTNISQINKQSIVGNHSAVTTKEVKESSFDQYLEEAQTVSLNDIFKKAANKYDVPVNLLKAIGMTESAFQVDATSHCGAQGIMQLMPSTAQYLGVKDAYDPEENIMGGAKLISNLLDQYKGDTKLALAAYNAGSGNVKKYGGIPPFKETQNYVVKVMNYMNQELNADTKVAVKKSSSINDSDRKTSNSYSSGVLPSSEKETEILTNQDKIDELFSYEDYLKFMEILMKEKEEDTKASNGEYQVLQQINITPTVANLLKSI